jgi:hypothetical protein
MNDLTSHVNDLLASGRDLPRRRFLAMSGAGIASAALALGTTGVVFAAGASTGSASVSGSLGVDSGGALASYVIAAPSGQAITLTMNYSPFVSEAAHRVGFNVYQNGAKLFGGTGKATGLHDPANTTTVTAKLTPKANAGPVLVQVFNYGKVSIDFTLDASGASLEPSAPAETRTIKQTPASASQSDSLGVDSAGTFATYVIRQPSGQAITLTMNYSPFDAESAHRVGFSVYQNAVKLFSGTGKATGLHDPANTTTITAKVTPKADAGPVLVQVFNYGDVAITFTVDATGALLATTPPPMPRMTAQAPASATQSGHLDVNSAGTFANYEIGNPSGEAVTLTLNYAPFDAVSSHGVGFTVYQDGVKLFSGTGKATGLHDPENLTTITAKVTPKADAGPVLVQVYNYGQVPIDFTLDASGAMLTGK